MAELLYIATQIRRAGDKLYHPEAGALEDPPDGHEVRTPFPSAQTERRQSAWGPLWKQGQIKQELWRGRVGAGGRIVNKF